ncbi:MAG: nucleoside phosphorylase [Isosphaeraceae bacterium]
MSNPEDTELEPGGENRPLPILDHPLLSPTVFSPVDLVEAVRKQRGIAGETVPEVCVLDFDGDLTDELVKSGEAAPCPAWPCFHTAMWTIKVGGARCGLIPRTIGGPYAVLVAEQLAACGVRVILGLASAGRIDPTLPLPAIVVANRAVRDEGTSFHYLPPSNTVWGWPGLVAILEDELKRLGMTLRVGTVWTTDAPYRETALQVERYRKAGVLAVEMQAASLFAFSAARQVPVGLVAHLTNAPDYPDQTFDKGSPNDQRRIIQAICRGGLRLASVVSGT